MGQYKDLFVETAKTYLATLSEATLNLEKTPDDAELIDSIFRAAHSLKGQSAAMGYEQTGYLCHVVEDVFFEVKEKRKKIDPKLVDLLLQALDALTASVDHIETVGIELVADDVVNKLKIETGINTVGSGKSMHTDEAPKTQLIPKEVETRPDKAEPTIESLSKQADAEKPAETLSIKTIPVKVEQLDEIVGSLEELMVYRLTMKTFLKKADVSHLSETQDKISKLIELLQFQIMRIRTVPLNMIFAHFPRAVRDLGRTLNKKIEFRIEGGDLELDRVIVESLDEPLTHLIRNAADHGIGTSGIITLSARSDRDFAIVSVNDNGNGIDWNAVAKKTNLDPNDKIALKNALFSGISTSSEVSLISGRGVGLEVVKKAAEDFGGSVDVTSITGKGTTFTLKLPLTVSIMRTLIVEVGSESFAIAAFSVETSLKINNSDVVNSAGQEAFRYNDQEIPIIRMQEVFNQTKKADKKDTYIVIISVDGEKIGLAVDRISQTLEAVVKPLPPLLKGVNIFSGVTIVGDGSSVLLINPKGLTK